MPKSARERNVTAKFGPIFRGGVTLATRGVEA